MPVERGLLLIADIGGYTRFMKHHRMSLAHAQDIVARLLEALIDAAPTLRLIEIEGDAAFFYLPLEHHAAAELGPTLARHTVAMHRAFHVRRQAMVTLNACACDGCVQTGQLRVKFVAHAGEVAPQRVKRTTRLAGFDVIVIHRMLKNSVPVPEYVLMSESAFAGCDEELRGLARELEQELEGLGTVRTWFIDLADVRGELPPPPRATWVARQRTTLGVLFRSLPYALGFRKPIIPYDDLVAS